MFCLVFVYSFGFMCRFFSVLFFLFFFYLLLMFGLGCFFFFFFKQKTAYEMRISDWSSDVCSSDLDTFGEIIVLGIAALAIFALLQTAVRGASGRRLLEWIPDLVRSPERHPMMFAVATRLLLPLTMLAGLYIFLRGHNMPGGGFIAGLVISIALLMQYMASGFAWADQRRKLDEHAMIGFGVIIAALTGLGSLGSEETTPE